MGLFDSLTDLAAEVIASPVTLTAKAIDVTIKTAEAIPEVAEKTIDKIEKAVDKSIVTGKQIGKAHV